MNVNKNQIMNGVIQYAKAEIINNITDKPIKMMVAASVKSLEVIPALSDKIFDNPLLSTILQEENGTYNLDKVFQILFETMDEYGEFPITIPIVKTPLIFNKNDVLKLKQYIEGGVML